MSLQTWWMFVVMTFVVSATPGPNMMLVMSHSARFGFAAAIGTMAGCMTVLVAMMSISAAGVGALLHTFPRVFEAMRLAGACYLAYLGVMSWRSPVPSTSADPAAGPDASPLEASPGRPALYRQGMLVAASNPKAILFAAAFFPQFIRPDVPPGWQFAVLLTTFSVIEIAWYLVYAASGQRLAIYLRRPAVLRFFNRLTGAVFVGFALLMALVHD